MSPNLKLLAAFYTPFLPDQFNKSRPIALIILLIDNAWRELMIGGSIVSVLRGEKKNGWIADFWCVHGRLDWHG